MNIPMFAGMRDRFVVPSRLTPEQSASLIKYAQEIDEKFLSDKDFFDREGYLNIPVSVNKTVVEALQHLCEMAGVEAYYSRKDEKYWLFAVVC